MNDRIFRLKKFVYLHFPKYFEVFCYLLFFVVMAALGWRKAFYQGVFNWGDDFQWISWLYRIGRGEVPYRDFFMLYGPLLPYLFYLPFKLLGSTYLAWNIINYLLLPLLSLLMAIMIGRKVFTSRILRIVFLIFASFYPDWGFFLLQPWDFRVWLGLFTLWFLVKPHPNPPLIKGEGSTIHVKGETRLCQGFGEVKGGLSGKRYLWLGIWVMMVMFSSVDQGLYLLVTLGLIGVGALFHLRWNRPHSRIGVGGNVINPAKRDLNVLMQGVLLDFIKGMAGGFAFIYLYFLFAGGFKEYFSFSFGSLSSTQRAVGGIPFPALPLGELAKGAFAFLGAKELLFYIPFLLYAGSWVYLIHCFIVSWLHGLPPLNPSGVTLRIFDLPPHITLLPKFKLFFTKESLTKKLKERLYTGNNLIVSPDGEKPSENFLGEWEKRDLIIPLFLTVYGSLSMMTVFVRSDLEHLSFASIPFLLLFFYYVERLLFSFPRLLREEKNRRRLFLKTTAAVFFITFGSAYLLLSKPDYEKGLLAVFYPRELFFSGEAQGLSLAPSLGVNLLNEQSWAVEDVKAEILGSQERIYQHGFFEGAYFLGNRRNFTYFDFDDWAGESEQKEIISKLEDNKVKRVFANEGFRITNHSLIDEYLRTYFKREKLIGEIALYVRNEVPFEDNFGEKGLRENLAVVWRETKKGTFELSLMGTEATKIRLAVRIAYLPLTGFLAKTKATLFVTSEESGEEKFLTETAFLLPYNQEGQVVFRLGEGRKLDKLRLVFEAPGAFNPFPTEIEIEKTWIYK